jgi:hypothetical protein
MQKSIEVVAHLSSVGPSLSFAMLRAEVALASPFAANNMDAE